MNDFDPVIVSYVRTPFGKLAGKLKDNRPDDLLAKVYEQVLKKISLPKEIVGEASAGCANQAGEDNRNVARMALLLAKFPCSIPGLTLNRLCSSSMDSVIYGARQVLLKEHDVVLCGGVESMTRAPLILEKSAKAFKAGAPAIYDSSLGWRFFNSGLSYITGPESNGLTAERLAKKFNIARKEQDELALLSHQRALRAIEKKLLFEEILPIGDFLIDEGVRSDTNIEKLSLLKPSFLQDGTVTAGNSSPLSDGASAMVVCAKAFQKSNGLKPLATILGYESCGVDPKEMGIAPVISTQKLLKKLKMNISDIDLFEINEAFAAQVLSVARELNISAEKININGGAIAQGHPLGASGCKIIGSLLTTLRQNNKELGIATMCVGVGQGVSVAIKYG